MTPRFTQSRSPSPHGGLQYDSGALWPQHRLLLSFLLPPLQPGTLECALVLSVPLVGHALPPDICGTNSSSSLWCPPQHPILKCPPRPTLSCLISLLCSITFQITFHILTAYTVNLFILFMMYYLSPLLVCKLQEGKGFCLFCSFPKHLLQLLCM